MSTQTFIATLQLVDCPRHGCGITFGIEKGFEYRRRSDHKLFYCPNGHDMSYGGLTKVERQAKRAEGLEDDLRWERMRTESWKRSAAAQKGQVTRIRNLIANGICPVAGCRRNFDNVREHMANQHPDFHKHEVKS